MEIKAIPFRKDGFSTQPFVFGGEEGPAAFDPAVKYRSGLTNYLIDTGLPAGTPFEELPEDWHCPRCRRGKDKFNRA